MGDRLGLGLIGCGVISRTYLNELRRPEQKEWALAAVCDTDPEKARAAAGEGTACYTDVERLLADAAVDAVAVLLPNYLHAETALQALAARKPVLVEKPMATTLEACDRMIAASEASGVPLMVGMTSRFCASYRDARARLHAGEYGALNFIAEYCNYRTAPGWYIRPWLKRAETLGGGMFMQMGIHNLDRAVWLSGAEPRWAHAAIRNRSGVWADETGLATLGLADGTLIQFQTDGLATQTRNETVLHCSEATVSVTQTAVTVHRQPEPEVTEFPRNGFATELRAFAAAVRAGGPSPLDGRQGRQAVALCLACYESDRTGGPVRMDQPPWHGAAPTSPIDARGSA